MILFDWFGSSRWNLNKNTWLLYQENRIWKYRLLNGCQSSSQSSRPRFTDHIDWLVRERRANALGLRLSCINRSISPRIISAICMFRYQVWSPYPKEYQTYHKMFQNIEIFNPMFQFFNTVLASSKWRHSIPRLRTSKRWTTLALIS